MPLPVVGVFAGLASYIGGTATAVIAYFTGVFGKKIAFGIFVVSVFTGFAATFYLIVKGLIASIAVEMPFIEPLWGCFVPDNLNACVSAVLTTHAAKWVYHWQSKITSVVSGYGSLGGYK